MFESINALFFWENCHACDRLTLFGHGPLHIVKNIGWVRAVRHGLRVTHELCCDRCKQAIEKGLLTNVA